MGTNSRVEREAEDGRWALTAEMEGVGKGGLWQQGLELALAWNRRKAVQEVRGLEEGGKNGVTAEELVGGDEGRLSLRISLFL